MTRELLTKALEKILTCWPKSDPLVNEIRAHFAQSQGGPVACKWTLDDELSETYASSCGELWSFVDGGALENRVRYCHGCGKPVELGVPAP